LSGWGRLAETSVVDDLFKEGRFEGWLYGKELSMQQWRHESYVCAVFNGCGVERYYAIAM